MVSSGRPGSRADRAWQRIERWLSRRAPVSAKSLRPPAPDTGIRFLQTRLGRRLPPDLVASLRRHDGVRTDGRGAFSLPPFHTPLPVERIGARWGMLCDIAEDGIESGWRGGYTPIAGSPDIGNLYADQRPGRAARLGDFFNEDGARTAGLPGSYAGFLETTADLLESGRRTHDGYRATVRDGYLDWERAD